MTIQARNHAEPNGAYPRAGMTKRKLVMKARARRGSTSSPTDFTFKALRAERGTPASRNDQAQAGHEGESEAKKESRIA